MKNINENNVVDELKNRNEEALIFIIDNYGWIIKTILKNDLKSLNFLYEECFNDCLLNIWNNIFSYNPNKSNIKTWISAIAKYKCIDYKRKYIKSLERNESLFENINYTTLENDVSDSIIKKELENDIKEFLSFLNDENKSLFWDRYIEEYGVDELSSKYKISNQAVYNRINRIKNKIKNRINKNKSFTYK